MDIQCGCQVFREQLSNSTLWSICYYKHHWITAISQLLPSNNKYKENKIFAVQTKMSQFITQHLSLMCYKYICVCICVFSIFLRIFQVIIRGKVVTLMYYKWHEEVQMLERVYIMHICIMNRQEQDMMNLFVCPVGSKTCYDV